MGGAYLSRPVKTKVSESGSNSRLAYGVSSMQGWRLKQEDAHNCIMDFDENTSLFGVYDGHGGFEVAKYTSECFPNFLRSTEAYKQGKYKEALVNAFLGFDDTIPTPEVIAILTDMVKADNGGEAECNESGELLVVRGSAQVPGSSKCDDCDEDLENPEALRAEANKPIEEVMASYCGAPNINALKSESSAKSSSPFLRGRREPRSRMNDGAGSSSSAGCSSSNTSAVPDTSSLNGNKAGSSSSGSSKSCTIPKEESKEDIPSKSTSEKEKTTCVNGTGSPINSDISEEADTSEKRSKRIPVGGSSSGNNDTCEIPGTSPKKHKKLGLDDLEDSTTIKNFITNDEIAEDDEDDSEDETFQPTEDTFSSDDDDGDKFGMKKGVAKHFLECLKRVGRLAEDDDDDDDDDSENEDEDDESESDSTDEENENSSETAQSEDGLLPEEGEEEDDDDLDEENIEEESGVDSEDDEDDVTADMFSGMSEKPGIDSGCTAVVALLKGNDLFVANAGDSRCIVSKAGQAVDMSEDHKPEDELECERVIKAGGQVTSDGRVNGGLNLSRAIGDHCYKKNTDLPNTEQMITALPDVRTLKLEPDIEFVVLACDGIWNSMTSQEVVDFVRPKIQENISLTAICEQLFDKCLAPGTWGDGTGCDNMTCIIVKPFYSEVETPSATLSGTAETDAVDAAGDAAPSSKSNGKPECAKSSTTLENDIADAGDTTEKLKSSTEEQSNGPINNDSTTMTTMPAKAQKRCSDELNDDDNNKRQKTDNPSLIEVSSQAEKTS